MADFSFFLPLPKKAKPLVKKGDSLGRGEKVATFWKTKKHKIDLVKQLKVSPKKVSACLLVKLGQKINFDEPLAKTNSFLKKNSINSPVSGQVFAFDSNTGDLTIETIEDGQDLLSPFSGKVEKISQEGVTIKMRAKEIVEADDCWGEDLFGQLTYHSGTLTSFDCQYQRKIVLADQFFPALINKAQAINALAIISDDKINLNNFTLADLTLVKVKPQQASELKKFINYQLILDCQQKKIIILDNEN